MSAVYVVKRGAEYLHDFEFDMSVRVYGVRQADALHFGSRYHAMAWCQPGCRVVRLVPRKAKR
jgi:hypothetical protein